MAKRKAEERPQQLGADTVDRVTTSVNLLVVGEVDPRKLASSATMTDKLAKALKYREQGCDIEIIDAEEFKERLSAAEG